MYHHVLWLYMIPSNLGDPKTMIQNWWKYRNTVVFHRCSVSKHLLEMLFGDNKPLWPWMNGGDPFTSPWLGSATTILLMKLEWLKDFATSCGNLNFEKYLQDSFTWQSLAQSHDAQTRQCTLLAILVAGTLLHRCLEHLKPLFVFWMANKQLVQELVPVGLERSAHIQLLQSLKGPRPVLWRGEARDDWSAWWSVERKRTVPHLKHAWKTFETALPNQRKWDCMQAEELVNRSATNNCWGVEFWIRLIPWRSIVEWSIFRHFPASRASSVWFKMFFLGATDQSVRAVQNCYSTCRASCQRTSPWNEHRLRIFQ